MAIADQNTKLITKVWAHDFRSIEAAELELEPLTVLVGPNASGKSNLMDILRFIQDASIKGLELAIGNRGGIEAVARRPPAGAAPKVAIGISMQDSNWSVDYSFTFANRTNREYAVLEERMELNTSERGSTAKLDIVVSNGQLSSSNFGYSAPPSSGSTIHGETQLLDAEFSRWSIGDDFGDQDLVLISNQPVVRGGFLPNARQPSRPSESRPPTRLDPRAYSPLIRALNSFVSHLHSMSFYRIFPNSLREPQKMAESNPLLDDGSNLASAIQAMERREDSFMQELRSSLSFVVPEIRDVRVSPAGSYLVVEVAHDDNLEGNTTRWFDLSSESDGTLRLIGLLVAFLQQPSPTLFAVEEPEMNVHPGAMAMLVDTMTEATGKGQVLVTTHSPDLINMVPIDCIRAVSSDGGSTKVGRVAQHQMDSIVEELFSAGELHSTEGLQVAPVQG